MLDNRRERIKYFLLPFSAFMACITPRFLTFLKVNLGIHVSFYAISVFIIWLFYRKRTTEYRQHIQPLFFYVLLICAAISIWQNLNINRWGLYLYYIFVCILLMQTLMSNNDREIYERITVAVSVALLIHVVIGHYEVITHTYLFDVGSFASYHYGNEAISIFYNPNDYSTFITTMLPFAVYRFFLAKNIFKKLLYAILILGTVNLIILTSSRAAIAALAFAAITLFVLFFKKDKLKAPSILLILFGLLLLLVFPPVRAWLKTLIENNSIDANGSDTARINLIKNGFHFLRETFGLGVGAGNLEVWFEERAIYPIGRLRYMHNWYMEILTTFGVLVFVLYFITHVTVLWESFKMALREEKLFDIHTAFLLSFVIFSVTSIASSSNVYSEWVWMYLAVMIAYLEKYRLSARVCFNLKLK